MNKKIKSNKKKKIIILLFFIIIIVGVLLLINKLLPVKDITDDDIHISLSTDTITGNNITATISTDKHYDIYYYIQLDNEEIESYNNENSEYYEKTLNSDSYTENYEEKTNTQDTSSSTIIEDISDNQYIKCQDGKIIIENNATIYLKYGRFNKRSSTPYTLKIDNIDKQGPEIGEIETSSTDSTITVTITAYDTGNPSLKYYFKLSEDNDFICTDTINSYTFTNLSENETYIIYIKVTDGFGNETEAATDAIASSKISTSIVEKKVYYFKVNLAANTVTVYDKDENGEYTEPIKAMICSTGKSTPKSGTYKISYKYRWLALFGNVYGQYAVRIHGNILFHSVPYLNTYPNTLEYEEYDKLGTSASAGCVRLTVKDAKWIYDNAATGSYVEFYSNKNDPGPLGKPSAQKISNDKEKRDWDPTDPDTRNPWTGGTGIVYKTQKNTQPTTTNKSTKTTNTISDNSNSTIYWDTKD